MASGDKIKNKLPKGYSNIRRYIPIIGLRKTINDRAKHKKTMRHA
jgi:hypothetical protein